MTDSELIPRPEPEPQTLKGSAAGLYDWLETLVVVLACVVLFFTFLFRVVTVSGPSMMNTLLDRDQLIITDLFYTPRTGDIVVLHVPNISETSPLIKRVIATGGQTVDIDYSTWTVTVDGVPLSDPYVNRDAAEMNPNLTQVQFPYTVDPGYVFVMGDNRDDSKDSRNFGEVDERYIYGHVLFRFYPFNKLGTV